MKYAPLTTVLAGLLATLPFTVHADEAPAPAQTNDTTEVVVTATKRSARLQTVPISISVITGTDIANRQLRDGLGVARQTPNLIAESAMGAAMPRYRLRGIGTDDFTPTTSSPVGIYEDEVYLSAGAAQSAPLYDLERVEVLRGPQGSLWGKNTTAGALHFVTAKPSDTASGHISAVYGSDNTREVEAAYGGPISSNLSGRIAGVYKGRDGQFDNAYTGKKDGGYDIWDLRAQLKWQINDGTSLLVKAHGGVTNQAQPLQHVGLLAGGTDFDGYAQGSDDNALSNNGPSKTYARRQGLDATFKTDFGGFSLTNIAGYERSASLIYSDDDANPISKYHERYGGSSETFTDELRLASTDGGRFGWIGGLYGLHDKTNTFGQLGLYSPINFGVDGAAYDLDVTTDNLAAFASLNYAVTPRFKLTAGARYTWEKKSLEGKAWDYTTNPNDVFDASTVAHLYIDTKNNTYVNEAGVAITPTPSSKAWDRVTWDLTADYQATDTALIFGRVARGFRSGNYNTYIATPGDLSLYNPETLTSYELGAKTSWFDRKLILNGTVFHYDFDDMQVTVLQNVGTRTVNAAAAKVDGIELEATIRPTANLVFNLGYGHQKSEYTDFKNASVPYPVNLGNPLDLTGQPLERAPADTFNVNGTYSFDVGNGRLSLNTDWRYTSRYRFHSWSDATNTTPAPFLNTPEAQALVHDTFSQEALWLGDARISYRFNSSGLEISAWVKNLTDEVYRTNTFAMFFNRSMSVYPGERRTAGIGLNYRF